MLTVISIPMKLQYSTQVTQRFKNAVYIKMVSEIEKQNRIIRKGRREIEDRL